MAPKRRGRALKKPARAPRKGLQPSRPQPAKDFVLDVAAKSGLTCAKVHALLRGLKTVAIGDLEEKGTCSIAGICVLKIKILPPRCARLLRFPGKRRISKARAAPLRKIVVCVVRPVGTARA